MNDPLAVFAPACFRGRVYGVTGGSKGVGAATVRGLLGCGASVMAVARGQAELDQLKQTHLDAGDRLRCACLDVADDAALDAAIDQCASDFGRIDGWVNNAMHNPRQPLDIQTVDEFESAWRVNTRAAWRGAKRLLPHFDRIGAGAIVNVSSIMADQTTPEVAAYTSSKAGLEGLTRALAVELAPRRVRVNALSLGFILTYSGIPPEEERCDEHRRAALIAEILNEHSAPWPDAAAAEQAAAPVLFLLSDAAGYVTGATLTVDGGLTKDMRILTDRRRLLAAQRLQNAMHKSGGGQ